MKNIKRPLVKLACFLFTAAFVCAPQAAVYAAGSGMQQYQDRDLWYTLDADGTLTLTGTESPGATTAGDPFEFNTDITKVILEDGMPGIGPNAFQDCSGIVSVSLPESGSVVGIGDAAFLRCSSLKEINLPYGITYIGSRAFEKCASLEEIKVPDSVTTLGVSAFDDCTSLKRLQFSAGLTKIDQDMCYGDTTLTEISIPASVIYIYHNAFTDCDAVTDIYYEGTEEQWNQIEILGGYGESDRTIDMTQDFPGATVHYGATDRWPAVEPTVSTDTPESGPEESEPESGSGNAGEAWNTDGAPTFEYDGHLYAWYDNSYTSFDDAESYCEGLGGHLATIGSEEEDDALFAQYGANAYYIGLTWNGSDWEWVDGTPVTYTHWFHSVDTTSGGVVCVMGGSHTEWSVLTQYIDDVNDGFVCEWDSLTAPVSPEESGNETEAP